MHQRSTTDGNSLVHFRTADVVSVGDLMDLTGYPFIDLEAGGSVQAIAQGLNRLIDITVPNKQSEEGTLVIPGRGRVADQPDVVYYYEMVNDRARQDSGDDVARHDRGAGEGGQADEGLRHPVRQVDRGLDDQHVRRGCLPEPQTITQHLRFDHSAADSRIVQLALKYTF